MLNLIKKLNLTKKLLTDNVNREYNANTAFNKYAKYKKTGGENMGSALFLSASEVAEELGVSKPFAYKLVRQMNDELESKGFITIAGRVSRKYFEEKLYGVAQTE